MREPRIYLEGAVYYTTVRAGSVESLFQNSEDYEYFLGILGSRKRKYNFRLYAFCLLPHHYHLLIEAKDKNISKIMQAVNTSYSLYFNKKYHRQGHLVGSRFAMQLVNKDDSLLELTYQIHLNPKRCGLLETPEEYRFSSYREYIDRIDDPLVDCDYILSFLGTFENKEDAKKKYQEIIKERLLKEPLSASGQVGIRDILKTEEIISHNKLKPRILVGVGSSLLIALGLIFLILRMGVLKETSNTKQIGEPTGIQKRSMVNLPDGLPTVVNNPEEEKQVWEFWKN